MRGLARELGVSLASVQHRYPTKDAVWRAALDRVLAEAEPAVADGAFPEVVRRRMAMSATRPSLLFALLTDDAPGHEERLAHLADRLRPAVEEARAVFEEAGQAGLTRPADISVLAALMMVGVGALAALPAPSTDMLGLGPDPPHRLAAGFTDIVLNGVVARPGEG